MQSYYSNRTQPYPLAGTRSSWRVASTFNETLLIDHMLASDNIVRDDDTRISLLGNYLENIKGTVFRQTQFAGSSFGCTRWRRGERSPAMRWQAVSNITKRYYGHDQGVDDYRERVDHPISIATSRLPVRDLVRRPPSRGEGQERRCGREATVSHVLSAGGSRYPIDLLKDAGVDMTTDEPLDLTMKAMTRVMDEMEALLAKRAR
jgi:oligoendopeptidase F